MALELRPNCEHCDDDLSASTRAFARLSAPSVRTASITSCATPAERVRAATDPTIPNNGGCFRPIRLTLPEGTLVNPRPPAPVNARTATIKRITGCMLGALAQAQPERAPAPHAGELVVMAFGGHRRDGTGFVTGDLLAGGSGAAPGHDGVDAIETDATNCMNVPAEAMELEPDLVIDRDAVPVVYLMPMEGWLETAALAHRLVTAAGRRYGLRLVICCLPRAVDADRAWEVVTDTFLGILLDATWPGLRWDRQRTTWHPGPR